MNLYDGWSSFRGNNNLKLIKNKINFMAILFTDYTDAILNDVLIFDFIKTKAPEFVGHSKRDNSCYVLMVHYPITPCELK